MTDAQIQRQVRAHRAFQPSAPISERSMFAGRSEQIQRVITATMQKGQHVILYGERGVGKTSLARIIHAVLRAHDVSALDCGSINCDTTDDFSSLWHKIFAEFAQSTTRPTIGFAPGQHTTVAPLAWSLPPKVSPNDVRTAITSLGKKALIIIDELDRLTDPEARSLLADTIKLLSDHTVNATVVLVGVAESVNELIAQHESIDRALVQVHMPRMSQGELLDIISAGEKSGVLPFTMDAKKLIVGLSQGLPHYTHLLALESSLAAIYASKTIVSEEEVRIAISTTIKSKATIAAAYDKAVRSQFRENLHEKVLLACALAHCDAEGYFMSPEIADKLAGVTGTPRSVSAFQRHLAEFCSARRGEVLYRKGERRAFRYRFRDPLMQPYVLLQGVNNGLLKPKTVYEQLELGLKFE